MRTPMRAARGFILLLAGCSPGWGQNVGKPIEATLCDLYQRPEQYAGSMIRVRAGSVGGELRLEDILHDSPVEPCRAYMHIVAVFPDQVKPAPGFQIVQDESYKKLVEALHYPGPIHIDATYEGRFDSVIVMHDGKREKTGKGYGKGHRYDGRIVLQKISNVQASPIPHR